MKDEFIPLSFNTTRARTRHGWQQFYFARDRFLHEQLRRHGAGIPFGTYKAPDGNEVETILVPEDLKQHTLIVGATGSGKSSLLEILARYQFERRSGVTLIDLHGDLYTRTAAWALKARAKGLTLLDFTQPDLMPSWNAFRPIPGVDVGRQVDLLVGVLKRLYADETAASWAWGVKVEELMRHAIQACIETKAVISFVDLPQFFLIPAIRQRVIATASEETRAYFTNQFGKREEMYVSAAVNKLHPFLASIAVQRFLGRAESTVDLLGVIERGDTVLVNLAKGYLGPAADVIGRLIVNVLQLATLRREAIPPRSRTPYAILLDEAHNLAGPGSGLEDFLVAARKYGVFVTVATQALSLFKSKSFREHIIGNTGRQFFFRMSKHEAQDVGKDIFEPLGTMWREQVRPYDALTDPLLTPVEEIVARTNELANLPIGACYWLIKGRRYKARRIQVTAPADPPYSDRELRLRVRAQAHRGMVVPKPEIDLRSAMLDAASYRDRLNLVKGQATSKTAATTTPPAQPLTRSTR